MKRKKGEKIERIERGLEMSGALDGGSHIEIFSNKRAIFDGISGVIEYSDCFIKLNLGRGTLEIKGNRLEMSSLDADGLTVDGGISSIEFCV